MIVIEILEIDTIYNVLIFKINKPLLIVGLFSIPINFISVNLVLIINKYVLARAYLNKSTVSTELVQ